MILAQPDSTSMQLILWRHAEASDIVPSDLARNLTLKGQRQAAHMAAWLRRNCNEQSDDNWHQLDWQVLVSPANRTQQTALALKLPFLTCDAIAPDLRYEELISITGWPKQQRNIIVVGHQPTLGMAASHLLHGQASGVSVKKGAIWWFETTRRDDKFHTRLRAMAAPDAVD